MAAGRPRNWRRLDFLEAGLGSSEFRERRTQVPVQPALLQPQMHSSLGADLTKQVLYLWSRACDKSVLFTRESFCLDQTEAVRPGTGWTPRGRRFRLAPGTNPFTLDHSLVTSSWSEVDATSDWPWGILTRTPSARHCTKFLPCILLFNLHNCLMIRSHY